MSLGLHFKNTRCLPIQIADFGLARIMENTTVSGLPMVTGYVVTRHYRAPEVVLHWQSYDKSSSPPHLFLHYNDRALIVACS